MHRIRALRRLLVASFAGALIAAVPAPTAQANGFTTIECAHSHFAQVDPLTAYSATNPNNPSAHPHEFFGNESVNASSTPESLAAGTSSCRFDSDLTAMWAPALIKDGDMIPGKVIYRHINDADPDEAPVTVPPNGLSLIHGAGVGTNTPQTTGEKTWACRSTTPGVPHTSHYTLPASCPTGTTYIENVTYNGNGCWDPSKGQGGGLGRTPTPGVADPNRDHMFGSWANLDCDAPYVKVPRFSVIFRYPPEAAGGYFASDDHDQDGDPDVIPSTSFHVDLVYVHGFDGIGQSFYDRVNDICLNPLPGNNAGYPYGMCVDSATTGKLKLTKDYVTGQPVTVLEPGQTYQSPEPPASAVNLLGYDHATAPAHWYGLTGVSPNPPWVPIAPHPALVEAPPCEVFEKELDWFHKSGPYTWTDDPAEKTSLLAAGWTNGGTKACTVPATAPASVPLFRCDLPNGDRVLTTDEAERDSLVTAGATSTTLGNVYPPA